LKLFLWFRYPGLYLLTYFQSVSPPFPCSFTSQDVTSSFLFPSYRAYPLVTISPHYFQSPDVHLTPSFASSFIKYADLCVIFSFG
jgi:hypothetical protein